MKYVFHSSRVQNLKVIEPRVSTHGELWVYATESLEKSAVFLGNFSDLIIQVAFQKEGITPCVIERFRGALEVAYAGFSGSIYTLDGSTFKSGMTSFDIELVNTEVCNVLVENKIDDVLNFILQLEKENKVIIYRFPNFPEWYPNWEKSLITKAVLFAQKNFIGTEKDIKEFHLDRLQEFYKALEEYKK